MPSPNYIMSTLQNKTNNALEEVKIDKQQATSTDEINVNEYEFPISLHQHIKHKYLTSTPDERKEFAASLHNSNRKLLPVYIAVSLGFWISMIFLYQNYFVDLGGILAPTVAAFNYRSNRKEAKFFTSGYEPQRSIKASDFNEDYKNKENINELNEVITETSGTDNRQENQNNNNNYNSNTFSYVQLEPDSSAKEVKPNPSMVSLDEEEPNQMKKN